jgi:hypothetical protein
LAMGLVAGAAGDPIPTGGWIQRNVQRLEGRGCGAVRERSLNLSLYGW